MKSKTAWHDIELQDLFYAYRKAKVDCFKFTDVKCVARSFVEYERDLGANLDMLRTRLHNEGVQDLLLENLGNCRLVAKKLNVEAKKKGLDKGPHGYFSSPERAFANLRERNDLIPEFRLVGDFPVVMHVLSALWINTIGHKYDATLSKSAYGSRLRRFHCESGKNEHKDYHLDALGSFQPYFAPYKRWRENGLNAIRRELEQDGAVVAVSMDLTSYYHNIDPSFLSNPEFLQFNGITLSAWELEFTQCFVKALKAWAKMAAAWMEKDGKITNLKGGVPIGLAMARVAANVLLRPLDRSIESSLAPIYYGRYVDDIFLVLKDPGNVHDAAQLLNYIAQRSECFPGSAGTQGGAMELKLPKDIHAKSKLILKQDKQKIFFLQGLAGLDLLDNIESQIRNVSSERRLMPSPERLASMASAKILTAAGHPADEADTLRKADGLVVRRLGWAIQLRAVEILARDLRQNDWSTERQGFYDFAVSHILRPDKILDHMDYLPRLLSIAVSLGDWKNASRMLSTAFISLSSLRTSNISTIVVNGTPVKFQHHKEIWEALENSVLDLAADAISRSLRWSQRSGRMNPLDDYGKQLCERVGLTTNYDELNALALALRESDWSKIAYKDHLRRDAQEQRTQKEDEKTIHGLYLHEADLKEFLDKSSTNSNDTGASRVNYRCGNKNTKESPLASLLPYLTPTRPYSTQEISLFLPSECVFENNAVNPARAWAKYVRAVRGVWVKPALISPEQHPKGGPAGENFGLRAILGTTKSEKPRLGISSLKTVQTSYKAAAAGRQDVSRERYARLQRLINQAIKAYPRPTHLLLPELSLPDRWVETVSSLLRDAGVSLIAGLDYHHNEPDQIHSEAVLVLTDDRLGFPASVQIRQQKSLPAAGEECDLLKTFGKQWVPKLKNSTKPVYIHNGFHFGLLICSELQNVSHRLNFQGQVDCMMVLSWNRDLETFSALVESSSLDVHAHVALVNNRLYGDSRVRAPGKANHGRDLCRIRGGENEHVVVVELDIYKLRAFQSRATRWPSDDDPYKPVPEGFNLSKSRRTIPT